MRKIYIIIILLMTISILIAPTIGGSEQPIKKTVTYRVFVDQYHGFSHRIYEVYNITSGRIIPYNGTLNIYKGDTIVWISDTVPDKRLTIISQQNLWNNDSADLTLINKQFNYIFNNSGIYDVYIRQYPKFRQKIIVGPIESNTNTLNTNTLNTNTLNTNTLSKTPGSNSANVLKLNSTKTKTNNTSGSNSTNILKSSSTLKSNLSKEKNSTNLTYIENSRIWPTKYLIILSILTIIIYIFRRKIKWYRKRQI